VRTQTPNAFISARTQNGFEIRMIASDDTVVHTCTNITSPIRSMTYLPSKNLLFVVTAQTTPPTPTFLIMDPYTCKIQKECSLTTGFGSISVDPNTEILYAISSTSGGRGPGITFFSEIDYSTCDVTFKLACEANLTVSGTSLVFSDSTLVASGAGFLSVIPSFNAQNCTASTTGTFSIPIGPTALAFISDDEVVASTLYGFQKFNINTGATSSYTTSISNGNAIASMFYDISTTIAPFSTVSPSTGAPTLQPTIAPDGGTIDVFITGRGGSESIDSLGFDYRMISNTSDIVGSCSTPGLGSIPIALAYSSSVDKIIYINFNSKIFTVDPYTCEIDRTCAVVANTFGLMVDAESGRIFGESLGHTILEIDMETCEYSQHCNDQTTSASGGTLIGDVLYIAGTNQVTQATNFMAGSCLPNTSASIPNCEMAGITPISSDVLVGSCRNGNLVHINATTLSVIKTDVNVGVTLGISAFKYNPPPPPSTQAPTAPPTTLPPTTTPNPVAPTTLPTPTQSPTTQGPTVPSAVIPTQPSNTTIVPTSSSSSTLPMLQHSTWLFVCCCSYMMLIITLL